MVRLNLDVYTLSSSLPDSFDISLVNQYVDVSVTLQGQCIYTARLYEDDGVATFYELRQIVEQNMIARGLSLASLEVSVDHGGRTEEISGKYIIFSRYRNTSEFNIDFLESHFLVNRTYLTIPRDKTATLPFFATGGESLSVIYDCMFSRNGSVSTCRHTESMSHGSSPYVFNIPVSPSSVKFLVDREQEEDCGQLLFFTVSIGQRSMRVYVVDDEPCLQFYFRNAYNATETIFIFGTTTFKTEISRKEAVTQQKTSFYDKTVSRKWDVKTVPLSQEEALWYNEFLESDYVTKELTTEMDRQEILISDVTSEISDSAKDLVSIKFSYRYNDNAQWINP